MGMMDGIRKAAEVRKPAPPVVDKRQERPQPGRPGAIGERAAGGVPKIRRISPGRFKALKGRLGRGE